MRGDLEMSSPLVRDIIIAIITVFLLYMIFPRSSCDAEAKLSAIEIQKAVECAAGSGPQGCSKTATVKLCQEDAWSLYGFGYIQNYLGLMVPQYMIYYQKFPIMDVRETNIGVDTGGLGIQSLALQKWSDSYPFERSTIGERIWDSKIFGRPTLTEFKQFYKTKYLEQGCTSDTGLCVNVRGKEEVDKINLPDGIKDILLKRGATSISKANPKFHLVAPCFAHVNFEKSGENILASVAKGGADASNYCYADEFVIGGAIALYALEVGCHVLDVALTAYSGGSKAAIQKGVAKGLSKFSAEEIGKLGGKEFKKQMEKEIAEEIGKNGLRQGEKAGSFATRRAYEKATAKGTNTKLSEAELKALQKEAVSETEKASFWAKVVGKTVYKKGPGYAGINTKDMLSVYGIPCVNFGDPCRGAAACAEAAWWPGWPFIELTSEKMQKWKNKEVLGEIFGDCCQELLYGTETDFGKIICSTPPDFVDLVKLDFNIQPDQDLLLKNVTEKLGMAESAVKNSCSLLDVDTYKTCKAADEVKGRGVCFGLDSHTYTMKTQQTAKVIEVYARTSEEECTTKIKTSYYDGTEWKVIDERDASSYPDSNSFTIKLSSPIKIEKIKIEDSAKTCHLDYSSVALDPSTESAEQAAANIPYELPAGAYRFFIAPENFSSKASELCGKKIKSCVGIEKWIPDNAAWKKFLKENNREDFEITGGDKIGIMASSADSVLFQVKPAAAG